MRAYKINNYISEMGDRHFITKFGGKPFKSKFSLKIYSVCDSISMVK